VVIIGAGPSGLAMGYYLKKLGIHYKIVEKEKMVGASWANMPEHLHLITSWKSNLIVPEDLKLFNANKKHSAKEFSEYLNNFGIRNNLNISLDEFVSNIEKKDKTFEITTNKNTYHCSIVINCQGYYSNPVIPAFQMSGELPRILHFKDFKNAEQFIDCNRICIVGKRLSAGQVINELLESDPKRNIILSARSSIRFSASEWILNFMIKHIDRIENLIKKISNSKKTLDIPMHISLKPYFINQIKVFPDIVELKNKIIYFTDGSTEEVDAVIFTTGFERKNDLLKNDFESAVSDNLFFLGVDLQRTFTSRFLRGIRDDAPSLAKIVEGRLASRNNNQ
jgi:putative flavoprotein involved in K+ transport